MHLGEFLFLLQGLKWTVILSAIAFVLGGVGASRWRCCAPRAFRFSSASPPATSPSSRARRC